MAGGADFVFKELGPGYTDLHTHANLNCGAICKVFHTLVKAVSGNLAEVSRLAGPMEKNTKLAENKLMVTLN